MERIGQVRTGIQPIRRLLWGGLRCQSFKLKKQRQGFPQALGRRRLSEKDGSWREENAQYVSQLSSNVRQTHECVPRTLWTVSERSAHNIATKKTIY